MAEQEDKEKCQMSKGCGRRDAVEDGKDVLNVICHHSLKMLGYSVMLVAGKPEIEVGGEFVEPAAENEILGKEGGS